VGFHKKFFDNLSSHFDEYFKHFPSGAITFTIKLLHEKEVNVYRILKCDDELLTFAYYENKKQLKLPEVKLPLGTQRQGRHESTAFPAITVPYSHISWVDINPGNAPEGKRQSGFYQQKKD
jgi:hypothetical protein